MLNQTAHTATPWMVAASIHNPADLVIQNLKADILAIVPASDSREFIPDAANAAFIVQAVNAHDALVAALKEAIEDAPGDWTIADCLAMRTRHQAIIAKATTPTR